jgi:hypothetical protein
MTLAAILFAQNPPGKVVRDGRTLFTIQTSLGPFAPRERADHARARLANVTRDLTAAVDQISVVDQATTTGVVLGDRVLLALTDADAQSAGKSRTALANSYIAVIRAAVSSARSEYSTRSLLKGGAFVLLDTALLILILLLLRQWQIPPIRIQHVELASPACIRQVASRIVEITRWVLAL